MRAASSSDTVSKSEFLATTSPLLTADVPFATRGKIRFRLAFSAANVVVQAGCGDNHCNDLRRVRNGRDGACWLTFGASLILPASRAVQSLFEEATSLHRAVVTPHSPIVDLISVPVYRASTMLAVLFFTLFAKTVGGGGERWLLICGALLLNTSFDHFIRLGLGERLRNRLHCTANDVVQCK